MALVAVLLGASAVAVHPGPAGADEHQSWSLLPTRTPGAPPRSYFIVDVEPGGTLRDSVTLTNPTDAPIHFRIYPADAFLTPGGASFALRDHDEPMAGVGTWIELPVEEITVEPRTEAEIPFVMRVPDNAEPGDHAGGIAAMNTSPESHLDQEGVGFDIMRIVGVRMYARVAGPLAPAVEVTSVAVDRSQPLVPYLTGRGDGTITYEVTNIGNLRLEPTATVTITGLFGRTVTRLAPIELPELLPGSSVSITQQWSGLPPVEKLRAKISLVAGDVEVQRSTAFWVFPWLVAAVLALLATALIIRWRLRRRDRLRSLAATEHPAETPERELVTT
jgi:hypothetical protein